MKFGRIMQLWITGLMLSVSAYAYAAEEDTVTVSHLGSGLYEITVSGIRDSDTVTVGQYSSDISIGDCNYIGPYGCGSDMDVSVVTVSGSNPGRSTYTKKFTVFLQPGSYRFSFHADGRLVRNDTLHVNAPTPVGISLRDAAGGITGPDSFTLSDVAAETDTGQQFRAWGTFQWNPSSWSWELKNGGIR